MAIDSTDSSNTLPDGFQLAEFTVIKRIGEGGFSIVYLAQDTSLDSMVAIKEYMPSSLASRSADLNVSVKSDRYLDTFNAGMKSFINEAKLLRQFEHASVVKVYRFFESNGTAYMVMPFYEGRTLKQILKEMGGPPDEAWLKSLLLPVMEALELIHSHQCFHRDIAPDNIMILADGRPLLIDFGAARRVIGDMTQALTAILKPGFAPIEQYADIPGIRQGAWTDVYALAGVIYYALIGKAPTPSVARVVTDSLVPLTTQLAGKYSERFLSGIDAALKVRPEERIQSAAEFRTALGFDAAELKGPVVDLSGAGFDPQTKFDARSKTEFLPTIPAPRTEPKTGSKTISKTVSGTPANTRSEPQARSTTFAETSSATRLTKQAPEAREIASAKPPSKLPLFGGIAAGVAALAGAVWWFAQSPNVQKPSSSGSTSGAAPSTQADAKVSPPPGPTAQASAVNLPPASTPSANPPSASAPVASPPPAPAAPLPVQANPAAPATVSVDFANLPDAQKFIQTIEARANKEPVLKVNLASQNLVIGKDQLKFSISAKQAGFLYVFMAGTAGELTQLFPNGINSENQVVVDQVVSIPSGNKYSFMAGGPPGKDTLLVLLSRAERDFSESGARKIGEFYAFDYQKMNQKIASAGPETLLGRVACPATSGADCQSYWVSTIEVNEVKAAKSSASKNSGGGATKKSSGY
jgi:serine/threonine protein kinase